MTTVADASSKEAREIMKTLVLIVIAATALAGGAARGAEKEAPIDWPASSTANSALS